MKKHYIRINDKFMKGVKAGKITAIIFDKCPVNDFISSGDEIVFQSTEHCFVFSKTCLSTKIIQQNQLLELDTKQFGFTTHDLLIYDICTRFNYNLDDNNLYYILFLKEDSIPLKMNYGCYGLYKNDTLSLIPAIMKKMNCFDIYNFEYDETPWRD